VTTSEDKPDLPDDKPDLPEVETAITLDVGDSHPETASEEPAQKAGFSWSRLAAFVILPVIAMLLGAAAGYLKWEDSSRRDAETARSQAVAAAKDSTVALLSYKPDTVEKDLGAARDRLTGTFLDAYTQLVNTVVIPGAKEKKISALATVPAAAPVSAKGDRAVVLLFVDQTVTVGADAPTNTTSSVRVTLDKVGGRWLISAFDPI
jgi:Mce-associated membrane protein